MDYRWPLVNLISIGAPLDEIVHYFQSTYDLSYSEVYNIFTKADVEFIMLRTIIPFAITPERKRQLQALSLLP